jgi:hypothetical protein
MGSMFKILEAILTTLHGQYNSTLLEEIQIARMTKQRDVGLSLIVDRLIHKTINPLGSGFQLWARDFKSTLILLTRPLVRLVESNLTSIVKATSIQIHYCLGDQFCK